MLKKMLLVLFLIANMLFCSSNQVDEDTKDIEPFRNEKYPRMDFLKEQTNVKKVEVKIISDDEFIAQQTASTLIVLKAQGVLATIKDVDGKKIVFSMSEKKVFDMRLISSKKSPQGNTEYTFSGKVMVNELKETLEKKVITGQGVASNISIAIEKAFSDAIIKGVDEYYGIDSVKEIDCFVVEDNFIKFNENNENYIIERTFSIYFQ